MDYMMKIFILMGLQAIIGLVVWMFISEIIGAIIVWAAVGIDFIVIGIGILKRRHKE